MLDRMLNLVGIGRATVIDDTGDVQLVQVTEGATGTGGNEFVTDKVPRVAEFGFASVPPLGSVVTVLRRSGERARSFIMGSSHSPSRPRGLKPGDCGIYDVRGAKVMLTADGLLIDCAGLPAKVQNATKLTIDCPDVEMTGKLHVAGEISSDADLLVAGARFTKLRQAYSVHKHVGVKSGSDTSAGPDTAA